MEMRTQSCAVMVQTEGQRLTWKNQGRWNGSHNSWNWKGSISAADVALYAGTARVSGVPADSMALRGPEHLTMPVWGGAPGWKGHTVGSSKAHSHAWWANTQVMSPALGMQHSSTVSQGQSQFTRAGEPLLAFIHKSSLCGCFLVYYIHPCLEYRYHTTHKSSESAQLSTARSVNRRWRWNSVH